VPIEDRDLQCRVIRETIARTEHPTWDELIGKAADELKKNYTELGPLKIRTKNKPVHIEPGGNALLDLEVEVPAKLPPRRSFVATASIHNAPLTFELVSGLRK
jgi:hypothetical protein